jgi:hypothetical protein
MQEDGYPIEATDRPLSALNRVSLQLSADLIGFGACQLLGVPNWTSTRCFVLGQGRKQTTSDGPLACWISCMTAPHLHTTGYACAVPGV